jgi:hypothetical protein
MKRAFLFAVGITVTLAPSLALAQQHGINNEVVCAGPGSGMDPRCIGETSPGTYSDFYGAQQFRPYTIVRPLPQRR